MRRLVARQEQDGDYGQPSWVEDDYDDYSDPSSSDDGASGGQQQETGYDGGSSDPTTYSDSTEPTDTASYSDDGEYATPTYSDDPSQATPTEDTAYDSYTDTQTSTDYYDTETLTATTDYNPTPTDPTTTYLDDTTATPDATNTDSYYSPISYTPQPTTSAEDAYTTTAATTPYEQYTTTTDAVTATTSAPEDTTTITSSQDAPATSSDPSLAATSSASSAASPSVVLGTNECASDPSAVDSKCPSDSYCNAATRQCTKLLDNGSQCFEDFQCVSGHCNSNQCGEHADKSGPAGLSGGQLAGVTVGSVAGAVVLFILVAWLLKRRTRRNVSQRARKFEQVRSEDDDLERSDYMFHGTGWSPTMDDEKETRRTSKFNLLAAMLTGGTAVARSLSRLGSTSSSGNRARGPVDRSSYTPSDWKQEGPVMQETFNNTTPAVANPYRVRESKIADLSDMQGEDTQQQQQASSPRTPAPAANMQPNTEQTMSHVAPAAAATIGVIAGAAVASESVASGSERDAQENPYDDHAYYAQTLEPLTPMPAAHLDNNANDTDGYRKDTHQSWMSASSAIDPIGASDSLRLRDTADRPNTMALRESTFNNLHAPLFQLKQEDSPIKSPQTATSARNSWLLKEIASRWQQGSSSGARESNSSSTSTSSVVNDKAAVAAAAAVTTADDDHRKRSSLILGRDSQLWDDALVSTASSVVNDRPTSYAETSTIATVSTVTTNPFRMSSSYYNPRDSLTLGNVMSTSLPPHVENDGDDDDAWRSEDRVPQPSAVNNNISSSNDHHNSNN